MKEDLPRLMSEKEIDAILITGSAQHNPPMGYFTGPVHLTRGDLVYPRHGSPLLFHGTMERDEAAQSGLPLKNFMEYDMAAMRKEAGGDELRAMALRYRAMLHDAGVTRGRVALYGKLELNPGYGIFRFLEELAPEFELVSETGDPILVQAMATKSADEIARIRQVGEATAWVVAQTADFLSGHRVKNKMLIQPDGSPLRVGDVKRKINYWLTERGLDNPHGTIFAIGRDAGVPHSAGTPEDILMTGKTIVFDIFPCEPGGGYHYDMTRTWCLGEAPDQAWKLYEEVRHAYTLVFDNLRIGAPCSDYQEMVCDFFVSQGHLTTRETPTATNGYIHGLGHGVGYNIHEAPWFRTKATSNPTDVLRANVVMTVEPGLYYPEQDLGMRLEDTFTLHADGSVEILAPYPLDLVLPVSQA